MKFLRALSTSAVFLILTACGSNSDESVSGQKVSTNPRQMVALASDKPQDLLVVFEDSAVQSEAQALQTSSGLHSSHKLVVDLKAARLAQRKTDFFSSFDATELLELKHYSHLPVSLVRVQNSQALAKLRAHPSVVGVYEDVTVYRTGLAQSLPLIGQPQAAAAGFQGVGTSVAVIDTRVDYKNSAFGACTSPGIPSGCKVLVAQDAPGLPNDGLGFQSGHGTNVAATVLAVAPAANILSINVFNGASAKTSDTIAAINWCIANASVYNIVAINLSLGGGSETAPTTSSPYYSVFVSARAAGILPVAAAGNSGSTSTIMQPAAVVGAVSVGAVYDSNVGPSSWGETPTCTDATTAADQVTCFSNSASFLTLFAPGCRDNAADITFCGTSQASPHVAGAVAVLRSAFPAESLDQTVTRLTNGVPVTDQRNGVTRPRLSLPKALALSPCSYAVSPTSLPISADGTTASNIIVSTGTGCSWAASSNVNWITIMTSSGNGNGAVQYYVFPNNNNTPRTGTITVSGQSVSISQSAGAQSLSSQTNVWIQGNYGVQWSNMTSATLSVDQILNSSSTRTTGTLRLELWLSNAPFTQQGGTGWRVASYQIPGASNGTLGPKQSFTSISATVPFTNLPGPGNYFANFVVSEYSSNCAAPDLFCLDAVVGFSGQFFIPDVTPPTVPTGLSASANSASDVTLAWNPSVDDAGVASYKVYNNGTYIGSVTTPGASVSALSASTVYQFSVSACDASMNCSAQSGIASVMTKAFSMENGWWWNPAESGRGFAIERQGNKIFLAAFMYEPTGRATWYATLLSEQPDGSFTGSLFRNTGGQTLLGAYKAPDPNGTSYPATVSLAFSSGRAGVLTFTPTGGSPSTVAIERFPISTPVAFDPATSSFQNGWWFNPAENGRGYFVEVQGSRVFMAAFMYDDAGQPVWYASFSPLTDALGFNSPLTQYANGQTLGGVYKAPSILSLSPGALNFSLPTSNAGTLLLPNGKPIPLTRFMFN